MQVNGIKILFVSAEVAPFAKTGGLADVAGSLPKSLASMGNDVRIAMPRYKAIDHGMSYVADFSVQMGHKKETCIIRTLETGFGDREKNGSPKVYFIDNYHYFDRQGIYCHFDDAERFAFFCRATLDMLPKINFRPDLIHCNDWHTGPICMLMSEKYVKNPFYGGIKTVYTIHNLEYQGNFPKDVISFFEVGNDVLVPEKVEFYGMFSFMKAGLVYADAISTVSETYAKEILTERCGERLEGVLRKRSGDLFGIVNGICYDEYNPATDLRIYKNYSAGNMGAKKENKYALQKEMGLPVGDVPVLGLISRLSSQKGLDLIIEAMDRLMKLNLQFVLLGTGDEHYETAFKNFKTKYPDKTALYIGFNTALAQRIYAGSDMFLMPSRFEPCGLGQLISLRYGTIPIVRATGGLAETVVDFDADSESGNGFSFEEYSSSEMIRTVKRALKVYNEEPELWKKLVARAMSSDMSWDKSAAKYMDMYRMALKKEKLAKKRIC